MPEIVEGPVKEIAFLGIHINSSNMMVSLPPKKKEELRRKIEDFVNKKKVMKREMLSLIEKLSFMCKVLPTGSLRIFLLRMIDFLTTVKELHHHIYLSQDLKKIFSCGGRYYQGGQARPSSWSQNGAPPNPFSST